MNNEDRQELLNSVLLKLKERNARIVEQQKELREELKDNNSQQIALLHILSNTPE